MTEKRTLLLLCMIAGMMLLTACGNTELILPGTGVAQAQTNVDDTTLGTNSIEVTEEAAAPTSTPLPGAIGPYEYGENINPLTGLPVDDPSRLNYRPVIVKVSNFPGLVRPQAGIGWADLVFEHYIQAEATRFSALFYGLAPERVGSIRSARLIDYELAPMYDGILAFSGASIGVEKRIYGSETVAAQLCQFREDQEQCYAEADVIGPAGYIPPSEFVNRAYKGVLYGTPYYWRDESLPIPHNMFTNIGALQDLARRDELQQLIADGVLPADATVEQVPRPDLRGMAFHPDVPGGASEVANVLEVRYRTTLVRWEYNLESGRYLRWADGQQHLDANTGHQISAANVVVVYAGHFLTDIIEDRSGDTIYWSKQITVWPEGDAIILRDGLRYDVRWLRPTRPDLMTFQTKDGETFYLKPGNTWFQLVRTPDQMNPENEWVRTESPEEG